MKSVKRLRALPILALVLVLVLLGTACSGSDSGTEPSQVALRARASVPTPTLTPKIEPAVVITPHVAVPEAVDAHGNAPTAVANPIGYAPVTSATEVANAGDSTLADNEAQAASPTVNRDKSGHTVAIATATPQVAVPETPELNERDPALITETSGYMSTALAKESANASGTSVFPNDEEPPPGSGGEGAPSEPVVITASVDSGETELGNLASATERVVMAYDQFDQEIARFVCDGVDDQVEINSAIHAVGGLQGTVRLSTGTFHISSPILTDRNLILEGDGYDTLLFLADNSNCDVISSVGGPYNTIENVTIRNLRIDGNKANQFTTGPPTDEWRDGHGIYRTGGGSLYENLWIENVYRRGIASRGGANTTIRNNTLHDCDEVGIYLGEVIGGEISNNKLYNCASAPFPFSSRNDKGMAISVYLGQRNKILRNTIDGGGYRRQIGCYESIHVEIADNTLLNGIYAGIGPASPYARIVNNTIINSGENAIDTWGGNDNWIEGNSVSGVYGPMLEGLAYKEHTGICLNTSRTTCINNVIELCGKSGIHLGPSNNHNVIAWNTIRNCGTEGGEWSSNGIWVHAYIQDVAITGTIIQGNTIYDDQTVPTQRYGILLCADRGIIDDIVITDNDLRNNATAGINEYTLNRVSNITLANNPEL